MNSNVIYINLSIDYQFYFIDDLKFVRSLDTVICIRILLVYQLNYVKNHPFVIAQFNTIGSDEM